MFNKIKSIVPEKITDDLYYEIYLGKIINNSCFQTSLEESVFFDLLKKFNTLKNEVSVENKKEYTFKDCKLVVTSDGDRYSYSSKIMNKIEATSSVYDYKLYLKSNQENDPITFFNSTNYHNIEKIMSFNLINDIYSIHFKIITNETVKDKNILYSIVFRTNVKSKKSKNPLRYMCKDISKILQTTDLKIIQKTEDKVIFV